MKKIPKERIKELMAAINQKTKSGEQTGAGYLFIACKCVEAETGIDWMKVLNFAMGIMGENGLCPGVSLETMCAVLCALGWEVES